MCQHQISSLSHVSGGKAKADLVDCGLNIACVCCSHGLKRYWMLTAHLDLANLHFRQHQLNQQQ